MDKQFTNKTGLIRFFAYLTTRQISHPSPLPKKHTLVHTHKKPSLGNQATDNDFPDAIKGKGKARNFFGKQFHP